MMFKVLHVHTQTEEPNMSCGCWTSAEVLLCTKSTCWLNGMMLFEIRASDVQLQSHWSQSCDQHELIRCLVLKWENKHLEIRFDAVTLWWMRTTVSIHVVMLSAVIQLYFLYTWTQQQQSSSHPLKHTITTSFWLLWLADCSLCLSLCPITILLSQLDWGKQEILELCFDTNCVYYNPAESSWTDTNPLLTSESPVCSLDSSQDQREASLLNPAGCCYSAAALSDGRGWTSELRPEKHSWSLTNCSTSIWIKKKWW